MGFALADALSRGFCWVVLPLSLLFLGLFVVLALRSLRPPKSTRK